MGRDGQNGESSPENVRLGASFPDSSSEPASAALISLPIAMISIARMLPTLTLMKFLVLTTLYKILDTLFTLLFADIHVLGTFRPPRLRLRSLIFHSVFVVVDVGDQTQLLAAKFYTKACPQFCQFCQKKFCQRNYRLPGFTVSWYQGSCCKRCHQIIDRLKKQICNEQDGNPI